RQERRATRAYTGGQVRMCIHANHLGRGRFRHPRPRFHHLYRGHRNRGRVWQTHLSGSCQTRLEPSEKKVVVGDGAEWIWNLVAEHFLGGIEIVALYPARQPLWAVARQLYPQEDVQQKAWMKVHQKRLLDKGKIEKLVRVLRSIATANPQLAEKIHTEADYFERNAQRMRYPRFRRQHLFVGSGVIEAGCKTVIGSRLKQSGMFWTVRGANAILALRCSHLNG